MAMGTVGYRDTFEKKIVLYTSGVYVLLIDLTAYFQLPSLLFPVLSIPHLSSVGEDFSAFVWDCSQPPE